MNVPIKASTLTDEQKKIRDSVYNGWYMSGTYRAIFDGKHQEIEADSCKSLTKGVSQWLEGMSAAVNDMHLLVKCVDVH
jgi:hypothetical protein